MSRRLDGSKETKARALALMQAGMSTSEVVQKLKGLVSRRTVFRWAGRWREIDEGDVEPLLKDSNVLIATRADELLHDWLDVLENLDLDTEKGQKTLLKYAMQLNAVRGTAIDKLLAKRHEDSESAGMAGIMSLLAEASKTFDPTDLPALPPAPVIREIPSERPGTGTDPSPDPDHADTRAEAD
jgi:hypothetical protein